VALLAGAAGCSQPLTLPAAPASVVPKIADFTPHSAFAGDVLPVSASGLDPSSANNQGLFPGASARGTAFDRTGALPVPNPGPLVGESAADKLE
jgi:hypothetical protein